VRAIRLTPSNWIRFWSKVDKTSNCWNWTAFTHNGYGYMNQLKVPITAHRFAYMACIGPVPEGMELHHRCRNKQCVNPNHLQVVSRRDHEDSAPSLARARTHCPSGHPYDAENTWVSRRSGYRQCRTCNRDRATALREGVKWRPNFQKTSE
jgi:hypothetical protein